MLNVVPNLIASRDTFVDTSVLISMNPVFAAAFSENILVQDQSLSSTSQPFGLQSITLPSPWIPFVVTYPLLSVLMILARIYFVGKPDQ